jgi:hypothetical protein
MKQSLSFRKIGVAIGNIFRRHHIILFALTVVIGVSIEMLFLNNLINESETEQTVITPTTTFDKETMDRIDKLITPGSDTNQDLVLPDGRINPFVE